MRSNTEFAGLPVAKILLSDTCLAARHVHRA